MADSEGIPERLRAVEVTQEAHGARLDAHGNEIDQLKLSVEGYHAATNEKLDRLNETTSRIDRRLETEERRPADNWREFVRQTLGYVLAIALALVAARLGLVS